MDDRESLYFDTISLAESEAAAVAAAHRKSLSQSRNTIYHSAVDLAADETPSKRSSFRLPSDNGNRTGKGAWSPNYRHSYALGPGTNGGGVAGYDYTDAAIAAQVLAMQQNGLSAAALGSHQSPYMGNDEVSRRLIHNSTHSNSKDSKKLPITYSQWKLRTHRRFQDGIRVVDFVLAYRGDDRKLDNLKKREVFESNLLKEGLHLEDDKTQFIHFVKIHAPDEVLFKYAEILKIKLPMKQTRFQDEISEDSFQIGDSLSRFCTRLFTKRPDPEKFPPKPDSIYCEFSRNYKDLFDWQQPNFFDSGMRNCIINFILERQHFVDGKKNFQNCGIEKLLEDGVYESAYTLHDDTERNLLLGGWATFKKWKDLQPLDNIKDYFGPKVALYFAWLHFYIFMLIPVSIFGILCFIYGFATWSSDPISKQICSNSSVLMCPQCDRNCDYWELEQTCSSSQMNYLIDNNMTVVFAFIMSIWAVLYLELWKRYSAGLVHRWGLTGFSQHVEHPRPQYLARIPHGSDHMEADRITDPSVSFWRVKFMSKFRSYSIVVLFMCISVIAIFSLVVYRMAQKASHSILGNEDSMTFKIMVLPMTAGIIDLIVISLLDYVYSRLAVYLTNLEYCRTQTEYDESLTIKNYVFQFVNYYSSLFYIAFLKGKFVGYPAKYNRILGFRQEECSPGGCLMELCMQLVIIMVGKQAVNAITEMLIPYLMRTCRRYFMRKDKSGSENKKVLIPCNQWTQDYYLLPWTNSSLFEEYLEMILQFGFITIFGLAFPLAPLLALINNIVEVRLDAMKMLSFLRRPVTQRIRNIGVWYNILTILTKIAVFSSAVIIAFSTNLIPKLVYKGTTNDESLAGYLNFTLAYFNTEDFQVQPVLPGSKYENATSCRYTEFRNPPWDTAFKYKRPMVYWKILTARLAFIVIFQNIVGIIQAVVAWAVPDVPSQLHKRIKREELLLREEIIEYEKNSAAQNSPTREEFTKVAQGLSMPNHLERSASESGVMRQRHAGLNNALPEEPDCTTRV